MAKKKGTDEGLPYFKFVVSKWLTGDILDCTLSAQGLFMNLCALYWSKSGNLSYSKMKKKFPRKQKHFDELLNAGVLKSNSDDLCITFLDEQLVERGVVSVKSSEAAKKRWNDNKSDANALRTDSERITDAMPIEENREEEKRKEESRAREEFVVVEEVKPVLQVVQLPNKNKIFEEIFTDETFTEGLARSYPGIDLSKAWGDCWNYHSERPSPPEHGWQWRQKLRTWLDVESKKNGKQTNPQTKHQRAVNGLAKGWDERYGNGGSPQ